MVNNKPPPPQKKEVYDSNLSKWVTHQGKLN